MWNKTTYVLNLCIIREKKVKFHERLFFVTDQDFCDIRLGQKNVKNIENHQGKTFFPETFPCISYNTQIEYIGSFPHPGKGPCFRGCVRPNPWQDSIEGKGGAACTASILFRSVGDNYAGYMV